MNYFMKCLCADPFLPLCFFSVAHGSAVILILALHSLCNLDLIIIIFAYCSKDLSGQGIHMLPTAEVRMIIGLFSVYNVM